MLVPNEQNDKLIFFSLARGNSDAHILFSSCDGCDGYEIVIGAFENKDWLIREEKQGQNLVHFPVNKSKF